jgi:hypothetical protein
LMDGEEPNTPGTHACGSLLHFHRVPMVAVKDGRVMVSLKSLLVEIRFGGYRPRRSRGSK